MANATIHSDVNALQGAFDGAALLTAGASVYCSASDWTASALSNLHPELTPVVLTADDHLAAFALGTHPQVGPYMQPLEADWGFACPLLGPDRDTLTELAMETLEHAEGRWNVALFSGLPRRLAHFIGNRLSEHYRAVHRDGIRCQVARLDGGVDGFMSRRSALCRRNLRRDRRRCGREGITFELVAHDSDASLVMERVLAVDERSWKWSAGQSVLANRKFRGFYEAVLRRAATRGQLWALFAQQGGADVAYIFGGVLDHTYRGFQLGFDQKFATLGLGNQTQLALIEQLAESGVRYYDLGMEMDYKQRWSDDIIDLTTLVVLPHR